MGHGLIVQASIWRLEEKIRCVPRKTERNVVVGESTDAEADRPYLPTAVDPWMTVPAGAFQLPRLVLTSPAKR